MRRRITLAALAFAAVGLAAVGFVPTRAPDRAAAHGATKRVSEPVELTGAQLAPLDGAAADELWVYVVDHGAWERLPAQLDERDADGQYVAEEDGRLDANDVLVFTADQLGLEPRAPGSWPPGLAREHVPAEVNITDPLDADFERWAYVFRASQGPNDSLEPAVNWDPDARELQSDAYTLGYADPARDGFVGLARLSLFGAEQDLLDRMKIRASAGAFGTLTEEDLANLGGMGGGADPFSPAPLKVGPVRALLDPTGNGAAYEARVALFGGLESLDPGGAPIQITDVRISLDLSPDLGPVTYSDANVPDGVAVDGQPDDVPQAPLPAWRELTFIGGRAVFVATGGLDPDAEGLSVYYEDDASGSAGDTGDGMAYGDNGVLATTTDALAGAGFPGYLFALPVGRDISGADLVAAAGAPLETDVSFAGEVPTPLPTTPGPSPTPVPEGTPTAPAADGPTIFLPLARRG